MTIVDSDRAITVLHARTVVGRGGGADKTTLNSPRHLYGSRYRATAVFLHPDGDPGFAEIQRRARALSCPLIAIPERGPLDLRALRHLVKICRQHEIGIWHSHDYKTSAIGLLLKPFFGFRLVGTVHGWVEHSPKLFFYYLLDRWVLRRYERVVVVSKDLYETCAKMGVGPERLRLVENAIELDDYQRQGPAARALGRAGDPAQLLTDRSVPAERLVIGAVGRLSPEKGFDLLIEAVSRLCAAGLDLELWIAGEGPQEAALRQAIDETGCSDRIHLLGFCSDTTALFECFDIFCLPSLREGLPNVILEAMAMEVPVLATRCGGIEAALRDGEDSHLIPPGSVDALERGLLDLLSDGQERRRLTAHAFERVKSDFSFRHRMEKVIAIYDELFADEPR